MTTFTPTNPRYAERLHANLARPGFTRTLGTRIADIAPGRVVLEVEYRRELAQHHGFFHGGVVGTLADNACGFAVGTLLDEDSFPITSEYKINLLSPARGERLRAFGEVMKFGRTLSVCRAEVVSMTRDDERTCAVMLASLIAVSSESPDPSGEAHNADPGSSQRSPTP